MRYLSEPYAVPLSWTRYQLSDSSNRTEVTDVDYADVVASIDQQMERLGWDIERGQRYLIGKYGVRG